MKFYYYILICMILLSIYVYCYYIFPKSITILQTTLNDFDFNLLLQRQPLVIGDKIIKIDDIIKLWFSPNIIENYISNLSDNNKWVINNYKYLFVYCINDTELLLYQAGKNFINGEPNTNEPILAIKLRTNQSIIVPFKWYYNIKNKDDIKIIGIDDYITYGIKYIF